MSRRADRLFQIVQILRGKRHVTARLLAERLAVSERTIYRDIQGLSLSGVPVRGEAGSGYSLLAGFDLPPLMLTPGEVEATIAALRMVQTWSGNAMAQAAESAHEKLLAVLSPERRLIAERSRILAPDFDRYPQVRHWFDVCHEAINSLQVLHIRYQDEQGRATQRNIYPLGLSFWGEHWVMVSWCETREDYRCFRLDRCSDISLAGRAFSPRADLSLQDFLRRQKREKREKERE